MKILRLALLCLGVVTRYHFVASMNQNTQAPSRLTTLTADLFNAIHNNDIEIVRVLLRDPYLIANTLNYSDLIARALAACEDNQTLRVAVTDAWVRYRQERQTYHSSLFTLAKTHNPFP